MHVGGGEQAGPFPRQVAEEGLDMGEVDLVVCFDNVASPVRLVQRLGRTGRKREGRCVLLMTEPERQRYQQTRRQVAHRSPRAACLVRRAPCHAPYFLRLATCHLPLATCHMPLTNLPLATDCLLLATAGRRRTSPS